MVGVSPDDIRVSPDLIKERDQLEADLVASDFPGGIAAFAKFIDDYEKSFQSEALAYAMDVLLKYQHILHQEYDRYAGGQTGNMSAAAKTLSGLSKIREPAQELYGKAAHVRSLRKDLDRDIRDMSEGQAFGARAESASLGREAAIHESSADKLVKGALPDDPIVSWQDFPREKLVSKKTVEDVRYEIAWYIEVHDAQIGQARQLLTDKPSRIYTLDKLLSAALEAQDVEKGSIYDLIIQHRVAEIESEKKVKEILLAVLTVALTVVTFGGGTPALLASAAIVGIGGAQAYGAIEDYDTQTTFYVSQLLSQEPTAAWAVVAVVGLALDVGTLVSTLDTVVRAAKTFNATGDLVELGEDLAQVDPLVRESVVKAAEQARTAERQFKASVDQFKGVFTGAGGQAKAVVPSLTVMAAREGRRDCRSATGDDLLLHQDPPAQVVSEVRAPARAGGPDRLGRARAGAATGDPPGLRRGTGTPRPALRQAVVYAAVGADTPNLHRGDHRSLRRAGQGHRHDRQRDRRGAGSRSAVAGAGNRGHFIHRADRARRTKD